MAIAWLAATDARDMPETIVDESERTARSMSKSSCARPGWFDWSAADHENMWSPRQTCVKKVPEKGRSLMPVGALPVLASARLRPC
jgi:hypothetical protein